MSLTDVIVVGIAAWVLWEWVLLVLPWSIPPLVQPAPVFAITYGLSELPHWLITLVAATAAVAILHRFTAAPTVVQLGRRK